MSFLPRYATLPVARSTVRRPLLALLLRRPAQ